MNEHYEYSHISFFANSTGWFVASVLEDMMDNLMFQTVPEFIEPVFAKTCSFTITENERFGLVFAKTGSINSGTDFSTLCTNYQ